MGKRHRHGELSLTTRKSRSMRMTGVAFGLLVLAGVQGAEFLNSDFETLKSRLVGTLSFTENAESYDATFEAVAHGHFPN
jgi:hypothetical protein